MTVDSSYLAFARTITRRARVRQLAGDSWQLTVDSSYLAFARTITRRARVRQLTVVGRCWAAEPRYRPARRVVALGALGAAGDTTNGGELLFGLPEYHSGQ